MPKTQELSPPPRRGVGRLVCGRRSKWVAVVLWLVVIVLAFPLAARLTDAQDNDSASWLPGKAESTPSSRRPRSSGPRSSRRSSYTRARAA
ncbi:hypothetical protein GCM10010346_12640 [Streptomyces chryseus]|uniref:Uncharacterized protein n=1 Tax=Streptomyces chryseus TaxID=68186 RepID=A0ABQ3DN00_9ACTN|nr:hypothetical protein GCM10010346_12640 [Streptomyces chryseus]